VSESQQLIRAIKAHIAKGDQAKDRAEQHYISAGQHLKTLKAAHDDDGGNWAQWAEILKSKCDLSTGRASELMQIADGRTSQEKIREADAERKKIARDKNKKGSSGHPEESPPPEEPKREPNCLILAWQRAGLEARAEFVHACWVEITQAKVARSGQAQRQRQGSGPLGTTLEAKRRTARSRSLD
jgi:hypothetical protein